MTGPWASYCSVERVLELHRQAIENHGGDGTVALNASDCVTRSLGAAANAEMYAEAPTAGLAFAGFALYYLSMNHCFVDGNKRVGWLVAMDVLASLGLTIHATLDDVKALYCSMFSDGESKPGGEDIVEWLALRLTALT